MKRALFLLLVSLLILFVYGCSNSEPSQLSFDELEGLPLEEQVNLIVENTGLVEEFEIVIEDNSVAVVYPAEYISDSRLALGDSNESFPNLAMTLVEHLAILNFDEVVITSYEPKDVAVTGLTKVSALFNKDTIEELDFEEWKEEKEKFPQRFYRYSDSYLIRGNVWDRLDDESQEAIGNHSKNEVNSGSEFWEHYGRQVD